ncbi:hypothetical protein DMN91_002395 [Ooceraea biroi]|uniref:Protein takeout n=1 Tax=Ooceraea biroi TaxID=2015173 RepID=A0A3L8DV57_OOCBI|nr:protein takeout [Ooceraea biroi]RLU24307.1 hypothetical protein DMN91_002395 [Ooceraea biroi]
MKTISLLIPLIVATTALDLPDSFKTCAVSNVNECLAEATRVSLIAMRNGLKEFKLRPIDPLEINSIKFGDGQSAVSLKQEYWNITLSGITKNLQVETVSVDVPNRHYIVISKNPVMIFSANYKLGGRIMVLPVSGEGRCNISMYNLSTTHDVQLEAIERNGETYQKVKKYTIKLDPKNVKFEFDNLFNGDPVLGPEMLKFLNENSNLVYKEYKEPFEITFGTAFAHIADKVFTRVPYKKIYLT